MIALLAPSDLAGLPPFDATTLFTETGLAPLPTIVTVWLGGFYLIGVQVLRRRGTRWSPWRTIAFFSGLASFWFAASSGIGAYDTVVLSVHMVQHMILSMAVPLLLALGGPVTLALRTLPLRPRRWLLAVLHSRIARVLTFPPLTLIVYVLSPWVLYFTDWYRLTLTSTYHHEIMHVHLVLVGAAFLWPLVGVDPVPGRVGYPARMLLMILTLPFHAFLGVTIMGQQELLGGDWYPSLHAYLDWLPNPAEDQRVAGGILWGSGELIGLGFVAVLFTQWAKASMREARRVDRDLDRRGL